MDRRILRWREDLAGMKAGSVARLAMATVFPTYGCNFSCPGCHYNRWNEAGWQFVRVEPLLRRLGEAKAEGLRAVVLSGGGEPLLHRGIREIAEGILGMGLRLAVITNGTRLLHDAALRELLLDQCEWIRLSVYPETDLDATERLLRAPRRCELGVKLLVGADTVDFNRDLVRRWSDVPVSYVEVKPERGGDQDLLRALDARQVAQLEAALKASSPLVKGSLARQEAPPGVRCYLTPVHVVIDAAGELLLCCFFHGRKDRHAFGSLYGDETFSQMWHGERHRAARAEIDMEECRPWDCRFFQYLRVSEAVLTGEADPPSPLRTEFDDDEWFV